MLHFSEAILIANLQFIFTGLVGKICNPLPIWRPRWITVCNRGTVGQIANVALVRRKGEYLAPCFATARTPVGDRLML